MDIFTFFPSWLLLIAPIIFFSSIFFINTLPWKNSSNNPPSPPRLPIIGNLHQLVGKSFHQTLWRISQKYGPIMLLHLGSQPYLIISSSEMANEALKTHDHILSSRPRSKGFKKLTFNYMDLTFSPSGDHWKKMRKLLITEFFGPKRSRLFKNVTEIEVKGLIGSLSLNTEVNLDDMLTNLVTDISCKVIVGKSYREEKFRGKTLKEILNELVLLLAGSFSDIFPTFGGILDELSGWNSRLDKCFSDLDGFLEMVLDEHVDHTATEARQHEDLIDACSSQLTRDEMKGLLMNSINGSIDTTTMTMLWTMSEIVKNPSVMKKLQDEIRSCVGKKSSVEESDLTQMKYLKLVVKETLRLRSPAPWLLIRECESYCQIGGYDIFPGTRILINSWGIGKDPKIWGENANEFIPERLEKFKVDHCEMVPFGGGRRACPAANLATSIVELTIANLIHSFDWKTPSGLKNEDIDMEEVGTLVVKRKTPLCLVPIKHNWVDY